MSQSAGRETLRFGIQGRAPAGTYYMSPGLGGTLNTREHGTEIFYAGFLRRLRISVLTFPGTGANIVATVRVDGADTALTCSIVGRTLSASDLTNVVAITAGQRVSIKLVSSLGSTVADLQGCLEWAAS